MEHPGRCRDYFARLGADSAERANRVERLGLFLDDYSGAAACGLLQAEDRVEVSSEILRERTGL